MHVLLVGYSKIVQKRVLPALAHLSLVTRVDVASRTSASRISLPGRFRGQIYDDYATALSQSKADMVYVSTVNSAHAEWVEKALANGFHVVVDKPSFTSIEDARRLADLSQKSDLCLAEATTYAYHPQIEAAKNVFSDVSSEPTRLTAIFSFPPLAADNFRYKRELGGGALWDLGPYAVTPGRLFFNEEPFEIFCRVCTRGGSDNVDTSFSVLATYSNGRSMIGHFGFDTEYRNYLNILGPDVSVGIERFFTTPAEMENEIHIKQKNESFIARVHSADSFALFLQEVIDAIQAGNHEEFGRNLLSDACVLHKLRLAAEGIEWQ